MTILAELLVKKKDSKLVTSKYTVPSVIYKMCLQHQDEDFNN